MDYDFGIIGAGAAGLQLLHAMLDEPSLNEKRIILIDKESKDEHDRTWCFWELRRGRWDEIVSHSWEEGCFITGKGQVDLNLSPYVYKMIRSGDFYDLARERLTGTDQVTWIQADVRSVGKVNEKPVILLEDGTQLTVGYLFDSRLDKGFFQENDRHFRVWQHFKGWIIETEQDVFTPERFTMMDYRLKHGETTSFTYILPFTTRRALVEFTFFSPDVVEEEVYDNRLQEYMERILKIGDAYRITESEKGVIPMTDYPFHHASSSGHLRIGTAGSWVKPSSGYSFKNAERKARQVVMNLKSGRPPDSGLLSRRHRYYDRLFLDQLYRHNEEGESLFEIMYTRNDIQSIFRFLDEETTFDEEVAIMRTFPPLPFMGAIVRSLF